MSGKITLDDWIAQQPAELQSAIHQEYLRSLRRAADLQAVRQLLRQTQAELAAKLGTNQGTVSKLERSSEMTLKNLRSVVHHLGGQLDIVIRLPNHRPIRLENLSGSKLADEPLDPTQSAPAQ